tara:strand:+ start:1266 stop:3089 length:1824 start_codon:yes stop_codon:yes gene_type:complete
MLSHLAKSGEVDTLSYYEKFNNAVISYNEGRYSLAASKFSNILSNERDYRDPAAQLMMAKSQYHLKLYQKAHRSCKSILTNYPNSPYEYDALVLMGDIALQENNETKAFKYYLNARPQIEDILYLNEIDQRIYNCIGIGVKEESLEGLLFKEKNQFNRAIINLSRAYRAWMSGNDYDLEFIINEIDTFYLPGHFSRLFGSLKRTISEQNKRPITIAVLLPLSGLEKNQGLSYLLGLSEFLNQSNIDKSIRFLVFDTMGLVTNTLGIINHLSSNPEVIAILGPLTRDEVIALSGIKLQLPILIPKIELSGIADIADHLFFLSPSAEVIAKRTAEIIIKELNIERIAILSPGNGQIKSLTDHFINECRQLGIDPVAIEWYIEKPEDISRQLKNIRSTAWDLVPEDEKEDFTLNLEIDSLDALFDVDVNDFFELPSENKVEEMDKKDSAKVILETIEAFYVPIRSDELTFIGTQIPLYNFNTLFFVNEYWLEMSLLNQEVIGPHFQGMKIISDVNSAISNGHQDTFTNYYSIATDHVSFIYSIIEQGISKRKHFLENLKKNNRFDGLRTSIKFIGKNNNQNGSTQVLEYSKNKIKKTGTYNGEEFIQSSE